jgi:hypothetical protein
MITDSELKNLLLDILKLEEELTKENYKLKI